MAWGSDFDQQEVGMGTEGGKSVLFSSSFPRGAVSPHGLSGDVLCLAHGRQWPAWRSFAFVASLLFLLHCLFLLLLLAWAYTPKYNIVRKTSLSSLSLYSLLLPHSQGFLGGSVVKNLPANPGNTRDMGLIPGSGRSPGVRNGMLYSTLAWEIPWTEEPGGLQFVGSQRVGHN